MEKNSMLKYEQILSQFGQKVLRNLVKHVATDVNSRQCIQQKNDVPKYRPRRNICFKSLSSENSVTLNHENTFDSTANVSNTLNLSPIYEQDEINIYNINKDVPDNKIDNKLDNREGTLSMDFNEEKNKDESTKNADITWDNFFDPKLLDPMCLENSNSPMDIDTEVDLNVPPSLFDGNKSDVSKSFKEINYMENKVPDTVIDNFEPITDMNWLDARQDKENVKKFRDTNISDLFRRTTDRNDTVKPGYIDENAIDFNELAIFNYREGNSSALTNTRPLDLFEQSSGVTIKQVITGNNLTQNGTKDINIKAQPKKRLKQTKITDIVAKKVKKNNNAAKNVFKKEKYTKTIKNWLNNVNKTNIEQNTVVEKLVGADEKREDNGSNLQKRRSKTVKVQSQTRLANKDGVMKFK